MTNRRRPHLDTIASRFEKVLAGSPADYTELIWIETRGGHVASSSRVPAQEPRFEVTVLVRVRERQRFGHHRTGCDEPPLLQDAVRNATAQARCHAPVTHWRAPSDNALPDLPPEALLDLELSAMNEERGREVLHEALERGERGRFEWTEGRILLANSRGLQRRALVTSGTMFVSTGRGSQAGTARSSARTLQRLNPRGTAQRARDRRSRGDGESSPEPIGTAPAVLSSEAVTAFVEELSRHFLVPTLGEGEDDLQRWAGRPVASPLLDLLDDATDTAGMAFPFDLKGAPKRPLWLIRRGVIQPLPLGISSPEDQLGPFSAGGGEVLCLNSLLRPGEASERELLEGAHQGIWVSSFSQIEWTDSEGILLRCRARGLRRIRHGRLEGTLPDQTLEIHLAQFLQQIQGVGREMTSRSFGSGIFGGTTAPALLLGRIC